MLYNDTYPKKNKLLISQVQIKELIENAEFLATSKRLESSLSSIDEAIDDWIYYFYPLHFSESNDLFALFKQIIKKELFSQLSNNTKI